MHGSQLGHKNYNPIWALLHKLRISHYDSSFENRQFSPEDYRRHIRSSHTGWEYRYGIYLDDGWVYVYRSAVLLARFRYVQKDRFYTIKDVQKSDQSQEVPDIAIGEALKGEPDYREKGEWAMPVPNWGIISQQLAIKFEDRYKLL